MKECISTADILRVLADYSGSPVIVDSVLLNPECFLTLGSREIPRLSADSVKRVVPMGQWHILAQRFPRRAYVVIRDEHFDIKAVIDEAKARRAERGY
jgi:hypothetical protein